MINSEEKIHSINTMNNEYPSIESSFKAFLKELKSAGVKST